MVLLIQRYVSLLEPIKSNDRSLVIHLFTVTQTMFTLVTGQIRIYLYTISNLG
jgi:hypothetical protein